MDTRRKARSRRSAPDPPEPSLRTKGRPATMASGAALSFCRRAAMPQSTDTVWDLRSFGCFVTTSGAAPTMTVSS